MLALDGNSRSELNATSRPSSPTTCALRADLRVFNAAPGNADRQHALRHPGLGKTASARSLRLVAGTANKQSVHTKA